VRVVIETFGAVAQAPRHSEVNEQNPPGLEPNNQILAATLDRLDALAFELRRHLGRLVGPHEPRVVDLHALEPAAREQGRQARSYALDLGQLRHLVNLARAGVRLGTVLAERL
jgi:hypothetical protein